MSPGISGRLFDYAGGKGTVATWSQVVESCAAVPEKFKGACEVLTQQAMPFPYVVYAPVIVEARRKSTEKLLAILDGTFYIWELLGNRVVLTTYPVETITDIERGQILLYSWLTVSGTTSEGIVASTRVVYNTVTTACFAPFVDHVRPKPVVISETAWTHERSKFNYLESASYKFMNYGYGSLIRGERVDQIIWQPRIRRPLVTLFGRSLYRTLTVAHLTTLTDSEIIFIGDDKKQSDLKSGQYGGIWHYIPLRHVLSAALSPHTQDTLVLSVYLDAGDKRVDNIYESDNQPQLEKFCRTLEARLPGGREL